MRAPLAKPYARSRYRFLIAQAIALLAMGFLMWLALPARAQHGLSASEVAQYVASRKSLLRGLVDEAADAAGVPRRIAHALVNRESRYRVNVVGRAGEIGLVQIKLSTARGLGFRGSRSQLFEPRTNLMFGMKYAARALRCGGIHLYQRGIGRCKR